MKKKIAILAGALSLSFAVLTGCGTPKVEDILDGMYDTEIESAEIEMEVDIDVEAGDYAFAANASLSGEIAEDIYHLDGSVKYEVLGDKDSQDFEVYMEMDGDTATVYYNMDDTWYVQETDTADAGVEIDDKMIEKIQDATKDLYANAEVAKKTEKVGDEECYVLTVKPSGEDWASFIQTVVKEADVEDEWDEACETLEDELDLTVEDLLDYLNFEATLYVSKENKYLVKSEMDFSGIDIAGIIDSVENLADYLDAADMDADDIAINSFSISIEYSNINDTEVEIPDDVIDEAIDPYAWYDYDDDYDWDDDDYDWDDDDYDWDDDDDDWDYSYSSDYYDEDEGWLRLTDYWDSGVIDTTFNIPNTVAYDLSFYDAYAPYYYAWATDGYEYDIFLSSDLTCGSYYQDHVGSTGYDLFDYWNYGDVPTDGSYYYNYSIEGYNLDDDYYCYVIFYEDDDYYYWDVYAILGEYEDYYGDDNAVFVTFSDRLEGDSEDSTDPWFSIDFTNGTDTTDGFDLFVADEFYDFMNELTGNN